MYDVYGVGNALVDIQASVSDEVLKSLGFSKALDLHKWAAAWQDAVYNLVRPHQSLRRSCADDSQRRWQLRTPAMAANLTDHIWTVKALLSTVPLPFNNS